MGSRAPEKPSQRPKAKNAGSETHHLDELAVLHHHGVDDAEERLVAREEPRPARERVALEHALAGVFREDLNDASALAAGRDVPLEVAADVTEDGIELVRHKLVGGEDTERLRIP